MNLAQIEYMKKSSLVGENTDKFMYSFLDSKLTNDSFAKVFEIKGHHQHKDYIYIVSQNNKKVNYQNLKNPYYADIAITRI